MGLSICLLVSGGLGLRILKQIHQSKQELAAVFTNSKSDEIISYCKEHDLAHFIGNPRNGKANSFIQHIECDVLLSVNYLYIIEPDLIQLPKRYAINIHGSLLPKYRGRTPHVWAIINGEEATGISAHLIDENVDNGALLKQWIVPIETEDTGGRILEKFNQLYPKLVRDLLSDIETNALIITPQDTTKASYFGARTPKDGHIDWNWTRERIGNWIRAQARPYPGAFSYYEGQKIIIHHASRSDYGFHYEMPNGQVLEVLEAGIIVKTPNGAILLSDIESEQKNFKKGTLLA